jgi:hypothetical protein
MGETAPAPCPCAFYQAILHSKRRLGAQTQEAASGLKHSCLLNPGKAYGPDGKEIGLGQCTLQRQAQCQAQRRKAFARLYATLPSTRVATAAGG